MVYRDIWLSAGLADEIAAVTKCNRKTVLRWMRNEHVPDTPYALLDLVQNGRLEKIHSDWFGWRICHRTGVLWTPNGEQVHPGEILAIRYRKAQVRALTEMLSETKRTLVDTEFEVVNGS